MKITCFGDEKSAQLSVQEDRERNEIKRRN